MTDTAVAKQDVITHEQAQWLYYKVLAKNKNDARRITTSRARMIARLYFVYKFKLWQVAYDSHEDYAAHELIAAPALEGHIGRAMYFQYMRMMEQYEGMGVPIWNAARRCLAYSASKILLDSNEPVEEKLLISSEFQHLSPKEAVERVKDQVEYEDVCFCDSPVDGSVQRWTKYPDSELGQLEFYLMTRKRNDGLYGEPSISALVLENISWPEAHWLVGERVGHTRRLDRIEEEGMPF